MAELNEKGQIVDHIVVIDQKNLLIGHFEAIALTTQLVDCAARENIHTAAPQRGNIECRMNDRFSVALGFNFDVRNDSAKARFRVLSIRCTAFEPSDTIFQARFVLIDDRT